MSRKKAVTWSTLTKKKKITRLSSLWRKGLSDEKIAEILSATKGQIVGFRHKHTTLTAANRYTGDAPTVPAAIAVVTEALEEMLNVVERTEALPEPVQQVAAPTPESIPVQELVIEPEPEAAPEPTAVIEINIRVEVVQEEPGCVWPLAKSSSLKPMDCGKPVVLGFRCCEEHAPLLYGKRFTQHKT